MRVAWARRLDVEELLAFVFVLEPAVMRVSHWNIGKIIAVSAN